MCSCVSILGNTAISSECCSMGMMTAVDHVLERLPSDKTVNTTDSGERAA